MSESAPVVLSQDKSVPDCVLRSLRDEELVAALDASASEERESVCSTLRLIAEVERRRLYVEMGYRTMFDYCVLRLKYSEGAASRRIYSARAAAIRPELCEKILSGALNLSSVSRLAPHLTDENAADLIARASGAKLREVETLVAGAAFREARAVPPESRADGQTMMALPSVSTASVGATAPEAAAPTATEAAPALAPEIEPAAEAPARRARDSVTAEAPGVLRFVFRARPEFRVKIELAARLLGRRPDGRYETLFEMLVDRFLAREDPSRREARRARRSTKRVRRVPRAVRDAVWRRDQGRCAYRGPDGIRCAATTKLEYDHVIPWARGGASDDPANIRLLCRAHNLYLARKAFGRKVPPPS